MKHLACFLFWLTLSGQPAISGEIPEALYIPEAESTYPAWVAADRALTPSGEVDPSLFSPADQSIISRYLKLPAHEGCIRLGQEEEPEGVRVGPKAAVRQNLASTVKSAGWVFSAKVTARAPGFSGSTPGTLLEIVPEETFKGPRDQDGVYYIFVPVGTFSVNGIRICKTDQRYAILPDVGERTFLFIDLFWRNKGRFLWTGGDSGIVTINTKGSVSLPQRYLKTESWLAGSEEGKLRDFLQKSIETEN
jgi:hypothetical protein